MTNIKYLSIAICTLLTLGACSSEGGGSDAPSPSPTLPDQLPIHISTTISSRATDDAFEEGDNIGLFVVNRNADGSGNNLNVTGNHIDNCRFTYQNSSWSSNTPTYWKDGTTHADFYLYYPYSSTIDNVEAMPWNVKEDQNNSTAYKTSDLLIGKSTDVAPTETVVKIDAKHVMSQMIITLVAGNGFTESSLAVSNVSVKVNHLKSNATVNLSTGEVAATGNFTTITPLKENGKYKAIIIPQTVEENNLITVYVDGKEYNLEKAANFTAFEAGKSHQFTVTLNKTSNGMNVSISKWEDDGIDHGGTAE